MQENLTQLTDHLWVYEGHINVGVLREGNKALLIDFGDGSVEQALKQSGVEEIDMVLFTHHHRDQACGAYSVEERGARIVVPDEERRWFDSVHEYWNEPAYRWHTYSFRPHHLMLTDSVHVHMTLKDGDKISWGSADITAVATPGHTDGSLTYVVDVDGRRVAFSGDLIYDAGRIWELYSLQKSPATTDYHGFLGARDELTKSLQKLKDEEVELLVPSHGNTMRDPVTAIDALTERLECCCDQHVAISSLRSCFPDAMADYFDGPSVMPIRQGVSPPACLRCILTSWIVVSETGAAFVMDCGNEEVLNQLKRWRSDGNISSIEGLWITHYHDDHVDFVPAFIEEFGCELIADRSVAEVIQNPSAWRLPCISPEAVTVNRQTSNGDTWQWHEFAMTAFHFPGQCYKHGGLLIEGQGLRMFFSGDSFMPAGIGDYCAPNRNFLGSGTGYDLCIALLQELKPDLVFNSHAEFAFTFTESELTMMRDNLRAREILFGRLFPWDHPNYGMDESWVYCYPYEQDVKPGESAFVDVVVTNHSNTDQVVSCRVSTTASWQAIRSDEVVATVSAKSAGKVRLFVDVPVEIPHGRYPIPVDIKYGSYSLPQFTEAILVVT